MHYAPESSREFLPDAADTSSRYRAARSFHYRSAPIYLLTAVVGSLLAADVALGLAWGSAAVVFIAICGESIEGYTVDRAQRAIRRIFQLCPRTARVLVGDNEQEIPVEQVVEGDTLVVRPGERMPVDGVVAAGQSAVDQSA